MARVKRNLMKYVRKEVRLEKRKLAFSMQRRRNVNNMDTNSSPRSNPSVTLKSQPSLAMLLRTKVGNALTSKLRLPSALKIVTSPPIFEKKQSKCVVLSSAILFVLFGVWIIISVIWHFSHNNNICNNPNENVLLKHSELYVWNECTFKTYPFSSFVLTNFNSDSIDCNCRQATIDLQSIDIPFDSGSKNVTIMIESILINWNMLETLYIVDDTKRNSINLTESHHYNSKFLKILHLEGISVGSLGDGIENWKNLEYFYVSRAHWSYWPNDFNQLNQLSYFSIEDVRYLVDFPPNLCNMQNLRALHVKGSVIAPVRGFYNVSECLVYLPQFESLVYQLVQAQTIPYQLFGKSSVKEIAFIATNASLDAFDLNDSAGDWDALFEWNDISDTTYYLTASRVCYEWDGYLAQYVCTVSYLLFFCSAN